MSNSHRISKKDYKLAERLLQAYKEKTLIQLPFRTDGVVHIAKDLLKVQFRGKTVNAKGIMVQISPEENEEYEKIMEELMTGLDSE